MVMPITEEASLLQLTEGLLSSYFDWHELERFLAHTYPEIHAEVNFYYGMTRVAFVVTQALGRRGLINGDFFRALEKARPNRSRETAFVRSHYEDTSPIIPVGSRFWCLVDESTDRYRMQAIYHAPCSFRYSAFVERTPLNTKDFPGTTLVRPDSFSSFRHFLNLYYEETLRDRFPPFTYGVEWILVRAGKFSIGSVCELWEDSEERARRGIGAWLDSRDGVLLDVALPWGSLLSSSPEEYFSAHSDWSEVPATRFIRPGHIYFVLSRQEVNYSPAKGDLPSPFPLLGIASDASLSRFYDSRKGLSLARHTELTVLRPSEASQTTWQLQEVAVATKLWELRSALTDSWVRDSKFNFPSIVVWTPQRKG